MTPDLLRQQIAEVETAAEDYADAVHAEGTLRLYAAETEAEIAASLIGSTNAETGRAHSATSAAEAAKRTPEIQRLRADILDAERLTIRRRARYECARIAAWASVPRAMEGAA